MDMAREGRVAALLLFSAAAWAGSVTNVTTFTTEELQITGTSAEFKYTTGPLSGGKALASQQFLINNVAQGSTAVTYASASYTQSIATTLPIGPAVTVATLDLVAAVQTAMTLNAATFEPYPKSFTTNTGGGGCAGGRVGPASDGFGGNCRIDPFTNTASGLPAKLQSITIGTIVHTYNGSGADIATLGQINLGALNPQFLVQMSSGAGIVLRWTQLVSLSGSLAGAQLGDNMLCKDCTVYFATTSATSQSTKLTSILNAEYANSGVPEPSSWLIMTTGLVIIGWARKR